MSWSALPPDVRQTAERVLTRKQLEAWLLWEDDLSYSKIAGRLGLSTSGARNRVHAALRNIELALERQGPSRDSIREQDASRAAKAA